MSMTWPLRAAVLALVIISLPLVAEGQPAGKPARIGVLCLISCEGPGVDAFRGALRNLGYVEGRTLAFEYRDAAGKAERLATLADELVRSKVDLIFTPWGTGSALAAKPRRSPSRWSSEQLVIPSRLELCRAWPSPAAMSPVCPPSHWRWKASGWSCSRSSSRRSPEWASSGNPDNPYSALATKEVEGAARALGLRILAVRLSGPADLDAALATLKRERVEALVLHGYVATLQNRRPIIQFAAANRLPAMYPVREYVDEGGLLSYGANVADISRRAAHYADRILKGAKPAELPVEQTTTVELVVNRKTGAALGLAIPSALLLRADLVVE